MMSDLCTDMEQTPPPHEYETITVSQHIGNFDVPHLPQAHGVIRINKNRQLYT